MGSYYEDGLTSMKENGQVREQYVTMVMGT